MPGTQDQSGSVKDILEYRFQGFRLDVAKRCLFLPDGKPVNLKYRAFDTLLTLIEHRGETLSKIFLMDKVWQKTFVEDNNLNQAISNIRKALGDSKNDSRFIKTFSGKGYCFISRVECIRKPEHTSRSGISFFDRFKLADGKNGRYALSPEFSRKVFPAALVCITGALVYFGVMLGLRPTEAESGQPDIIQALSVPAEDMPGVIPDSVAVLPFDTINPEEDGDSFAAGFQNELINQLAKVRDLNLISREGVLSPVIQELSLTQLGQILRAEHLVTGTILFNGNDAMINVQILNPENGIISWATSFNVNTTRLPEMLSTYSEIALGIADALRIEVNMDERRRILSQSTESFEAYRYSLAAVNAYYSIDFPQTFQLSKQALSLDPDYVDALVMFGKANSILAATPLPDMDSKDHLRLALETAERIIAVAPEDPNGYLLKSVSLASNRDWEGAMEEVERLYDMNTPLSDLPFIATVLICLGEFDAAIEILEANLQLEPIDGYGRGFLLNAYESSGDRMQARLEFDLGNELTPIWWGDTVNIFLAMGRNETITDIDDIVTTPAITKALHKINEGDLDYIRSALDEFVSREHKNGSEAIFYIAFASYLNDQELALELMDLALSEHTLNFNWFWLPVFSGTTGTPGFRTLLDEYGVLSYWEEHGASEYVSKWALQDTSQ